MDVRKCCLKGVTARSKGFTEPCNALIIHLSMYSIQVFCSIVTYVLLIATRDRFHNTYTQGFEQQY